MKDDFTISADTRTHYGVRRYDLRELGYHGLQVRDSVSVRLNPYKAPSIIVVIEKPDGEKFSFEVPPMQFDGAGFDLSAPAFGEGFKAMPKTRAEKTLETIKRKPTASSPWRRPRRCAEQESLPTPGSTSWPT